MMNTWKSENLKFNAGEKNFMKITSFILPKLPGIETNVGKAFNLYRFLAGHLHTPASELVGKITENGKPLFDETNIAEMQAVIATHVDTPYFKQITGRQRGGAIAAPAGLGADSAVADPTRSKFWDKFIRKLTHTIGGFIPIAELCKNWEFYVFFLYSLEQFEMIGPFVSMALDSITLSLPVLSDIASTGIESMFMLLPIPYAALIGEVVGYIVGTLFLLFAIMLNTNRKHFGSAFKVSLELIPMFGDILAEAATNFEVAMERAMASRERMLGSLKKLSPTAYAAADYYVPSVEIKGGNPPDIFSRNTYATIGDELGNYAAQHTHISPEKLEKVEKIASNVLNIAPVALETATTLFTDGISGALNTAASNAAGAAVSNAASRATEIVNSKVSNIARTTSVLNKQNGGRRKTRRRFRR